MHRRVCQDLDSVFSNIKKTQFGKIVLLISRPSSRIQHAKARAIAPCVSLAIVFVLAGSGCSTKKIPRAIVPRIGARQPGIASWYGHPYHGRATASGEIYDMELGTAAHRRFAFGTWVRVDNLDNGKRTEVRINDRGPFVRGRIIDLSRAAARDIDMLGPGTAKVRLTVIAAPRNQRSLQRWRIQVASFRDPALAAALATKLEGRDRVVQLRELDGWTRVTVSTLDGLEPKVRKLKDELRAAYPHAVLFSTENPLP